MAETQGKTIIFLGDSITEGYGASSASSCFVHLVTQEGGFEKGFNFGVGGTRIAPQKNEMNDDWSEYFAKRIARMPNEADFVLVFGGTNDYGHGDAPMGKLGDTTLETFYGAMDTLLSNLIEKYPTSKIAVLTPIHRRNEDSLFNGYGVRNCGTLGDYVAAEKAVAEKYGIPISDLYTTSGICPDNPVNRETYTVDGLHPNDRGYRLIADKVLTFLKNVL